MQIEVVKSEKDKICFVLKKSNSTYANTLRRLILDEVPTMAVDIVEFEANNSILYDEMVALRLGLTPLTTDLKSYNLPSECKCDGEGCARCQVELKLKEKGNDTMVEASSLKSKDPAIKPVSSNMPIVKLIDNQDISLSAWARLGTGKDHAKWAPGHVSFMEMANIEIDPKWEASDECIEACPMKKFKILEKKGNKVVVNKDNLINCTMCNACVDCAPKGAIKVTGDDTTFVYSIESWGQLSIKDMMLKALDVLDKQCDTLSALL